MFNVQLAACTNWFIVKLQGHMLLKMLSHHLQDLSKLEMQTYVTNENFLCKLHTLVINYI